MPILGRVLVTGCNGFVGRHLVQLLRESAAAVFGIDRQPSPWANWIEYDPVDVADVGSVLDYFDRRRIDAIFHLAAVANPRLAAEDPLSALRTNLIGSSALFEACRRHGIRMLLAGTMEEYAKADQRDLFLSESSPLGASSIYGMTKVCAEMAGQAFVRTYGCRIIFTRAFNHCGPGQPPVYALSDFAKQCAEIAAGVRDPVITVGNVDVCRDFLDVSDVVRAYVLLMEKGVPGEVYNVCSSQCQTLRDLVSTLVSFTGKPETRVSVKRERFRSDEPQSIRGDSRKLRDLTGWTPQVAPNDMLARLFQYWRDGLSAVHQAGPS